MPSFNQSVLTEITNLQSVKNIVAGGATLKANAVLQEQAGGQWNAKTLAKRQALAKRILDSDEMDDVYSAIAMQFGLLIDPAYWLYVTDSNTILNDFNNNESLWNNVAKVTADDLI